MSTSVQSVAQYMKKTEKKIKDLEAELARYEQDPERLCATMDDHVENFLEEQGICMSIEDLCESYKAIRSDHEELQNQFEAVCVENEGLKEQVFHNTTKDEIKEMYRVNMELKEELLKQQKITLFRHCEGYIGGAEDADLSSPEWIQEMREALEEISGWSPYDKQDLGTVEQLLQEYREWMT